MRRQIVAMMMVLLLLAVANTGRADTVVYQGMTFHEFNGHYYAVTEGLGVSWSETESRAVALGGHLASITSEAEQNFINDTFLSNDPITISWIGLSDEAQEGRFVWTTGEPLQYTNWAPGEPNDSYGEDYVCINWHHVYATDPKGTWNDGGASANLAGIIELDSKPVPEPSTLVLLGMGAVGLLGFAWRRRKRATAA
jgi:hypothetical protein